jgi:NAD(P)-dependent dehydrogenase (short-subunit alcohol dehydrogenase family)
MIAHNVESRQGLHGLVEGRAALVTGAASGIGRATARLLVEHGARVAIVDVDGDSAYQAAEEIRAATGGQVIPIQADVADAAAITRTVQTTTAAFGALEILINNAAIAAGPRSSSDAIDSERWEHYFRVDFWAYLEFARAAAPWLERSRGVVVNNASSSGVASTPGAAPYATAKAAVIMLTRQLAAEWGPRGIRVNAVSPGIIATGFGRPPDQRHVVDPAVRARHEHYIPLGRGGVADDVARVILFLCSDLAGYVTGQNIVIDGGLLDMLFPAINGA